jgi:hypothetical protein
VIPAWTTNHFTVDRAEPPLAQERQQLLRRHHVPLAPSFHRDLGEAYLDQVGQTRTVANLKRHLERLGYRVILESTLQAN